MVLHKNFSTFHYEFLAMKKKLPFIATTLICPPQNSVFKNPPLACNYLQRNSPYATIYSVIHPWRFINSRPLSPLSHYKIHPWRFYMQGHWNLIEIKSLVFTKWLPILHHNQSVNTTESEWKPYKGIYITTTIPWFTFIPELSL